MKIAINPFDPASIKAAIAQVKQYKKDFLVKEQEFTRRLAEIGVRVAQEIYSVVDSDGPNDVVVQLLQTPGGYTVLASGETVGFLEFGTGKRTPEWDSSDNAGFPIPYTPPKHGTYGKLQGNNDWGWWYKPSEGAKAIHTYGIAPAEAMLTARNQIIEQVVQIAREVWK